MIKRVTFICEICGKESVDDSEIELCEAQHFGLSVEEKREYNKICKDVIRWKHFADRQAATVLFKYDADDINAMIECHQRRLLEFEGNHGIKPEESQIHLYKTTLL